MLYRTMISPSVFNSLPEEARSQRLFCSAVNHLLLDLLDNGSIVDVSRADSSAFKTFMESIEDWPIKAKQRVRELLKKLDRKNRFVTISGQGVQVDDNLTMIQSDFCRDYIKTFLSLSSVPFISGQKCCVETYIKLIPNIEIIDIDVYADSKFAKNLRRAKTSNHFGINQITKEEFERDILIPLFRDAKHVKIFDRYIGRSMIIDHNSGETCVRKFLKEGYRKTLEWMIEVFSRETSYTQNRHFEVYTGIDRSHNLSEEDLKILRSAFKSFQESIKRDYDIHISFQIKKEKDKDDEHKLELLHQRYMFTNQKIGISLDRGFELLFANSMRDVSVSLANIEMEKETNRLKELITIP